MTTHHTHDIRQQTLGVLADTITGAGGDSAVLTGVNTETGQPELTVAIVVGKHAGHFRAHLERFFAGIQPEAVGEYNAETGGYDLQRPKEN